jgi:hypothetical protein
MSAQESRTNLGQAIIGTFGLNGDYFTGTVPQGCSSPRKASASAGPPATVEADQTELSVGAPSAVVPRSHPLMSSTRSLWSRWSSRAEASAR